MMKVASSEFTIKRVNEDSLTEDSQASRKGVENIPIPPNCISNQGNGWKHIYITPLSVSPLPPRCPTLG